MALARMELARMGLVCMALARMELARMGLPSFDIDPSCGVWWFTRERVILRNMAGYLKVLSALSRSAAVLSKNPAVVAPAALSCHSLQQRNCEFPAIERF
ncbi:hypothetical protein JZ751_017286 [Albula glossodonta]|uniref:Uncharacterized protein n=1 Tax=Albula glossodonta TaxID=121402 RepID=A0A8T2N022_9TELE|nr:hypothetical protein JZ751_017286 [Albula glossodonta]